MRTRLLYEMFLPREARFPDEKFWTGSGAPIGVRKHTGPPKGTVGTTAKDWGATGPSRASAPKLPAGVNDFDTLRRVDPKAAEAIQRHIEGIIAGGGNGADPNDLEFMPAYPDDPPRVKYRMRVMNDATSDDVITVDDEVVSIADVGDEQ